MIKLTILILILTTVFNSVAQHFKLHVTIKNQPFNEMVIGTIRGDRFIPSDTVATYNTITANGPVKTVTWTFPANASPGIYRIVLGQTKYARTMDEPPQQLDFIFNQENIHLITDFNAPSDSIKIILSNENQVWFSFLQKDKEYRQNFFDLEMEVNYYQNKLAEHTTGSDIADFERQVAEVANRFNQMQMERDLYIQQTSKGHEQLMAARIIKSLREPYRDGYLTEAERNVSYQKDYFRYIDFSDTHLLNSNILSDKIFNYLVTYNQKGLSNEQREQVYIKAVDNLMQIIVKNEGRKGPVYRFVLEYLRDGFERLKMEKVLAWISKNYTDS